jgi:serine/threonine-protein kinase
MGEVWVAHHNNLQRDVAVKILRPDRMDEPSRERFQREARATCELTHPNTIRVFDYGVTQDGLCYYAMELLRGEDLGTALKREGPLRPERVARLLLQASRALAEAHGRGIIHRDLKPENLFVCSAGIDRDIVKVLDFGLAQVDVVEDPASPLTRAGCVVGTPTYIAPELLAGQRADARSDVYALGAVMYKLLTGRGPWKGANVKAVLKARLEGEPDPPSVARGSALPHELEAIVMQCLRRRPEERFPSAAELALALSDFVEETHAASREPGLGDDATTVRCEARRSSSEEPPDPED